DVEEPLDATVPAIAQLPQRLLRMAIETNLTTLPEQPPAWLADAGVLASGRPGQMAWTALREQGNTTLQHAVEMKLFEAGWPKPWPIIETAVDTWRVAGRLPDAVADENGAPWILALQPTKALKTLDYGKRIPLFLQWALLRLDPDLADAPVRIAWLLAEPPGDNAPWQAWEDTWQQADAGFRKTMHAQLSAGVVELLAMFLHAQQQPSVYFPKSASARNPNEAWVGGFLTGERDYGPGYARLLAGDLTFDDAAGHAAMQAVIERIESALALPLASEASA
ncbi:MAG: hypothetical protein ACMG50_04430, partial [Thermomonas sp.]